MHQSMLCPCHMKIQLFIYCMHGAVMICQINTPDSIPEVFCMLPQSAHVQSLSALDLAHSALTKVYKAQRQRADTRSETGVGSNVPTTLLDDATYHLVYTSIKASITKKGERSKTVDPQRNTIQDTYTKDDLEALVREMLSKGTPEMDRALAMATWAHSSVGRSDDVRLFFIADLIAPQYISAVGEHGQKEHCNVAY